MYVARLVHSMTRFLQRAAFLSATLLTLNAASAATHIAVVTKNSVPAPSKEARKLPIDVAASKFDYVGDTVVLQNVVITQGDTKVQADHAHATGLDDFDNSHWTFDGNVRINGEQHGSLKSDQAVVEFRNKYISKATITGSPAEFEQKRTDTAEVARGHAHEIVYNVTDGTVRLSKGTDPARRELCSDLPDPGRTAAMGACDDAWLSDGHNEISGPELVYGIREQRVQAATRPGTDDKVHIIIDPNANGDTNKKP
jgi:lipopolysaccharide export system protein LptA